MKRLQDRSRRGGLVVGLTMDRGERRARDLLFFPSCSASVVVDGFAADADVAVAAAADSAAVDDANPSAPRPPPQPPPREDTQFADLADFLQHAAAGSKLVDQRFIKHALHAIQEVTDRVHLVQCTQCLEGTVFKAAVRPVQYTCSFCRREEKSPIPFYSQLNRTVRLYACVWACGRAGVRACAPLTARWWSARWWRACG